MGAYINPPDESKEAFLTKYPRLHKPTIKDYEEALAVDRRLVCLVLNPHFTAAAIMYREAEMEEFCDPRDHRPKVWFTVPREDLLPVSNLVDYER